MDDQTVAASNNGNQSVGTVRATLMLIALVVEIVIHSVAAMYAHASPRPPNGPDSVGAAPALEKYLRKFRVLNHVVW
jgi:hypothetical protein